MYLRSILIKVSHTNTQDTMKATFSHNGKRYIYKVDGVQVRTSQKENAYECVAVRLHDGEFCGILACGTFKTCSSAAANRELQIATSRAEIALLKKEINYATYLRMVGYSRAMTIQYFRDIIAEGKREQQIAKWEQGIADLQRYSEVILTFVQE